MMQYRRQRVLTDIRQPERRGAFASREAYLRQYAGRRTKHLAPGRRKTEERSTGWGKGDDELAGPSEATGA